MKGRIEIKEFSPVIRSNPNPADEQFNLGVAFSILGRYNDAIKAFEQANHLNPNDADALFRLGHAYLQLNKIKEAREAFRKAFILNPIKVKPVLLGRAYFVHGRYQEAINAFNEAIRIDSPHPVFLRYNLGLCYRHLGRYQEAINAYQEAFKADFGSAKTSYKLWFELGLAYQVLNQDQKALDAFKYVINLEPDFGGSYYQLGQIFLKRDDIQSAIKQYEILKNLDAYHANDLYKMIKMISKK